MLVATAFARALNKALAAGVPLVWRPNGHMKCSTLDMAGVRVLIRWRALPWASRGWKPDIKCVGMREFGVSEASHAVRHSPLQRECCVSTDRHRNTSRRQRVATTTVDVREGAGTATLSDCHVGARRGGNHSVGVQAPFRRCELVSRRARAEHCGRDLNELRRAR